MQKYNKTIDREAGAEKELKQWKLRPNRKENSFTKAGRAVEGAGDEWFAEWMNEGTI